MTRKRHTRREILKGAAALTAVASFGATVGRAAAPQSHAQIDAVLRRATEAGEVPGVVAVAATDKGVLYEGAFGTRDLAKGPAMTLDTIFRLASMTKAVTSVAAMQELSNDVDLFPGVRCGHGLASVINAQPGPNGRSAGTLTWAGIFNTYYWIDPEKRVTGVILTQILPFADARAVGLYGEFERGIYDALKN